MTLAFCTFCVLFSPWLIRGEQATNRAGVIIPLIVLDEVPLSAAIKNHAAQAAMNFIIDPHVPSDADIPLLSMRLEDVTATEALDTVLKSRGRVRIENPATSVTRIAPVKLGIKPVSPEQIGNDTNAVVPVVLFDEVPIEDAIRALAGQMHLKITFDKKFMATPAGNSNISLRWKKLTAKQALVALLDNYELVMIPDQSGSSARITTKEAAPKSKSP